MDSARAATATSATVQMLQVRPTNCELRVVSNLEDSQGAERGCSDHHDLGGYGVHCEALVARPTRQPRYRHGLRGTGSIQHQPRDRTRSRSRHGSFTNSLGSMCLTTEAPLSSAAPPAAGRPGDYVLYHPKSDEPRSDRDNRPRPA